MIPVDADVAAAITSPDRVLRPTLSIDWDADGHGAAGTLDDLTGNISGWRRNQSWSSDLPDQVRIVEGSAAASLKADVVRGDILGRASTVTYQGVRSTANPASPASLFGFAGAPVGATTGSKLLIAVAVKDLTVSLQSMTDLDSIGAIKLGSGTTGMRLWLFQHRLRPATDPYDSISEDVDAAFAFLAGAGVPYAVIGLAYDGATSRDVADGEWVLSAETVSGTGHTSGSLTVPDGTVLVGFWAWSTGTSGTWTPPPGDTERADLIGAHASSNIAMAATTSPVLAAGTYDRTATTSAATDQVLMGLVALTPFPARDERDHAGRWLSPTNRDSPLQPLRRVRRNVRAGVDVLTGSGWQNVRRFTGFTRSVEASAQKRTAAVDCLDYRELMRTDLEIPPILDYSGVNASWLVSFACYYSGLAASPPPVDNTNRVTQLWIPMHGSLRAMLGAAINGTVVGLAYDDAYAITGDGTKQRAEFVTGPYVLGAYANHTSDTVNLSAVSAAYRYTVVNVLGSSGTRKGRLECQVRGDTVGTSSLKEALYVRFTDSIDLDLYTFVGVAFDRRLTFRVENGGADVVQVFGPTLPADGAWHTVGISWDLDAGTKVISWYLDGAVTTSNPVFAATHAGESSQYLLRSYLPVAEVHVVQCGTSEAWLWDTAFTPEAIIDRSLLELAATAYRGTIEAWKLCTDLAAAEQAVSYFDEDGVYRYRTRSRLTSGGGQTVQVVLADDTNVTDVDIDTAIDRVRNVATVPYTQPRASASAPNSDWIWTFSGSPIKLPGNDSVTVDFPFSKIPWAVDTALYVVSVAAALPNSYVIVNSREDGTGPDVLDINPFATGWTTTGMQVSFVNNTNFDAWIIEGAIAGYVFDDEVSGVATATDATSIKRYGRQPLAVSATPWIQRQDVAESLARLIVGDTAEPKPVITQMRIVGNPALQNGDRVRIVDRWGVALDGEFWVLAIDDDWAGPRFVQTLTCRQASTVGTWGSSRWGGAVWA